MKGQHNKDKRLSGVMRQQHVASGAFLVEFAEPSTPYDVFHGRVPPPGLGPSSLFTGKELQSSRDAYRTMERKGFRVTRDTGCLIPDAQYSTYQQGSTNKGHHRSFCFFSKWRPVSGTTMRNLYGWPTNLQISHLCHRRGCCRIDHLICEEQWRNQKRNYCGHDGRCDCGNAVACIRRYQMDDQADEPQFCSTREEVTAALDGAPKFVIRTSSHHSKRDEKAAARKANRERRKRAGDKNKLAGVKKQRKLARKSGAHSSSSSSSEGEE